MLNQQDLCNVFLGLHLGPQLLLANDDGFSHRRQDNLNSNNGFRLGFKAGVWYHDIGVSVGYKPVIGKNLGQVPIYNSMQIGISVRY